MNKSGYLLNVKTLNRRSFLLYLCGTLLGGSGTYSCSGNNQKYGDSIDAVLDHFNTFDCRNIGRMYINEDPGIRNEETLYSDIFDGLIHELSGKNMTSFISNKIKADFESGNVVYIQDWLYSKTEISLYAIQEFRNNWFNFYLDQIQEYFRN